MAYEFGQFTVGRLETGRWKENCYLVMEQQSGELAIIDPGDDAEAIATEIRAMKGNPTHILITHGHFDHVGAVSQISEITGLACSIDERDLALLRRAPLYAMVFEKKEITIPTNLSPFKGPTSFHLGSSCINAWHGPGHTPGSVYYHFGASVFTGDTLLTAQIGRTDFPGGNREHLIRSVEEITSRFPDDTTIFPGHGSSWTVKEAREWWEATGDSSGSDLEKP